jgi:hypothetical protein
VGPQRPFLSAPGTASYPDLRRSLVQAAWCLSDEDFQSRIWTTPTQVPPDAAFPFGEAISFVLDDMRPDDPSALVGKVLLDERELAQFQELSESLSSLIERIGPMGTFADASHTPEWEQVRSSARQLHRTLLQSDES